MGTASRVKISNNKGFSLTELIVTVGIMSILLGLGMLSYQGMMDRYNVEKQMKEMYIDLMSARIRAMQRNRIHFVTFPSTTQYAVYEDTYSALTATFTPDGDQQLTIGSDSLIVQKSLISKFPITYPAAWNNAASLLQFTSKGLLDTGVTTTGTVRVTVEANGEYDCMVISEIRNTLGKWDGTECKAK